MKNSMSDAANCSENEPGTADPFAVPGGAEPPGRRRDVAPDAVREPRGRHAGTRDAGRCCGFRACDARRGALRTGVYGVVRLRKGIAADQLSLCLSGRGAALLARTEYRRGGLLGRRRGPRIAGQGAERDGRPGRARRDRRGAADRRGRSIAVRGDAEGRGELRRTDAPLPLDGARLPGRHALRALRQRGLRRRAARGGVAPERGEVRRRDRQLHVAASQPRFRPLPGLCRAGRNPGTLCRGECALCHRGFPPRLPGGVR